MNIKKCIVITTAALFLVLAGSACKNGPSRKDEGGKHLFSLRKMPLSILLYPEQTSGSPRMNFDLTLLDVSGPEARVKFFNALLYEGQSPDEYRDGLVEGYRADYMETRDQYNENPNRLSMNWEYTEEMNFNFFSDRWVLINRSRDYYTGGAHGMSEKAFYTVDLEELKTVSWEDMFTAPDSPEFYSLILEALRGRSGLKKDAPLSSGIYFNDNPKISPLFFPGPGGLTFHWNPYDIAPYSEGHLEINIPWEKIDSLLNEEGQRIRNIFKAQS
jgi:hypothetical protein